MAKRRLDFGDNIDETENEDEYEIEYLHSDESLQNDLADICTFFQYDETTRYSTYATIFCNRKIAF